jgi:putative hydrolase of the HAD superfamily
VSWLLCDYGEVLSLPQSEEDKEALADAAGVALEEFPRRYWDRRLAYDRGDLSASAFWATVVGQEVDDDLLARLVELDIASWTRPNTASVAAVERAAARGLQLALLSNAPVDVARVIERLPWTGAFSRYFFSCDVREVKPAPAIFAHTLDQLGARPGEVVFVDDRPENVAAAAALGLGAIRFSDPSQFDAIAA